MTITVRGFKNDTGRDQQQGKNDERLLSGGNRLMDALKWILGLIIVLLQGCTVYAEQDHPSGERSKENRSDNLRQEQEYWTPERMREAKPAELPHVPITPTLERPTIKDEQLPAPTEENGFPGSEQIFQPDEQK